MCRGGAARGTGDPVERAVRALVGIGREKSAIKPEDKTLRWPQRGQGGSGAAKAKHQGRPILGDGRP